MLLVFGCLALPLTGIAQQVPQGPRYGDFTYQTNGASITITGYWNTNNWGTNYWSTNCVAVIPRTINNLPVTSIGDEAFFACVHDCFNMSTVAIPDSVTNIGYYAFAECLRLTNLTIPNGVVNIADNAFDHCQRLLKLTIPGTVISIGHATFANCCSLTNIVIPASVTNIGKGAFAGCANLQVILVNSANKFYDSVDGILFDKKHTTLVQYPIGRKTTHYKVPDGVVCIRKEAFDCCNLSKISLPGSVIKIEDNAFKGCANLTSITIPKSVNDIGDFAFTYCDTLADIYFQGNAPAAGTCAFEGSRKFLTVHYLLATTGWNTIIANPWDSGTNWRIIKHWKQESRIPSDDDERRDSSGVWEYVRKIYQKLML